MGEEKIKQKQMINAKFDEIAKEAKAANSDASAEVEEATRKAVQAAKAAAAEIIRRGAGSEAELQEKLAHVKSWLGTTLTEFSEQTEGAEETLVTGCTLATCWSPVSAWHSRIAFDPSSASVP